jgi:hypothetical protein
VNDPLAVKRRRLVKLLRDVQRDRMRYLAEHSEADYRVLERNPGAIERDVSHMREDHIDMLIAYHDPRGSSQPRCVW